MRFGPGISAGIVTDYGLDGPGIDSRWGRDFLPVQTSPGAHPASCTMGTASFPGVKRGRGVLLNTHPLLVPRSWKSRVQNRRVGGGKSLWKRFIGVVRDEKRRSEGLG